MMTYLLEHQNPHGNHFYNGRTQPLKAIVVHVSAGLQDLDMKGIDHSDAGLASYAAETDREVSWHSQSDTDSSTQLLPETYTAWHCRGYNSGTYGHEICKLTTDWSVMPPLWVAAALREAADRLRPVVRQHDVPLRHVRKADVDTVYGSQVRGPIGFVGHHQLDPERRTDPGLHNGHDTFPWARLFDHIAGQSPKPQPVVGIPTSYPRLVLVQNGNFDQRTRHALKLVLAYRLHSRAGMVLRTFDFGDSARRALQTYLGVRPDGVVGPVTVKTLQRFLNNVLILDVAIDGVWGDNTTKAIQRALNGRKF